jgi:hypothetical protein
MSRVFGGLTRLVFAPQPEPFPEAPRVEDLGEYNDKVSDARAERNQIVDQRKGLNAEISKTIRRTFYTLVGACLFCIVTLAGTPDVQLLTPEATVTLPILNYAMRFQAFLLVGPMVLICLTFYLHIFVGQHRKYPVPEESSQPMLPNFSSWTAKVAVLLLFYWMVPATLAVFAWKAWPRPIGPFVGALALAVTAILIVLQIRRCPKGWRRRAIPLLSLGLALTLFSLGITAIVPQLIPPFRQLDLFKADLLQKDLRGTNLEWAFMVEAILSGADLSGAKLYAADLSDASLIGADLSDASLIGTGLPGADLDGADLSGADLYAANLSGANLSGTDLSDTSLTLADLSDARLIGANLSGTDLSEADLSGTDLSEANLVGVRFWVAKTEEAQTPDARARACNQLAAALNWQSAYRDQTMACGAPIPKPPSQDEPAKSLE